MAGFLKLLSVSVLICLLLASGLWLGVYKTEGLRLHEVGDNSLAPMINRGDLAIDFRPKQIRTGDIISVTDKGNTVERRVTAAEAGTVSVAGQKGSVPVEQISGKTVKVIPEAGYLFGFLRRPLGLAAAIYLPAAIIVGYELRRLANSLGRRPYLLIEQ